MKTFKQHIEEAEVVNPFDVPNPERNPTRGRGAYRYKAQQMMKNRWPAQQAARQVQQAPALKPAEVNRGMATAVKQVRAAQQSQNPDVRTSVNPSQIAAKAVSDIKAARNVPPPTAKSSITKPTSSARRGGAPNNVDLTKNAPKVALGQGQVRSIPQASPDVSKATPGGPPLPASKAAISQVKRGGAPNNVDLTKNVPKVAMGKGEVKTARNVPPPPAKKSVAPSSTVKASLGPTSTVKATDAGPPLPTKAPAVGTAAPDKIARGQVPPPMRNPSPAYRIKRNQALGHGAQTSTPAVAGGANVPAPVRNPKATATSGLVSPANAATASPTSKAPTPSTSKAASRAPVVRQRGVKRSRPSTKSRKSSWGFGGSGSRATTSGQMINRSLGGVFEENVPSVVKESFESFIRNTFLKENHEKN